MKSALVFLVLIVTLISIRPNYRSILFSSHAFLHSIVIHKSPCCTQNTTPRRNIRFYQSNKEASATEGNGVAYLGEDNNGPVYYYNSTTGERSTYPLRSERKKDGMMVDIELQQIQLQQNDYSQRFSSVGRLYDNLSSSIDSQQVNPSLSRLSNATVAIVGLGGVGSWVAEALVRSGILRLILIDLDDICISNINRQVHATTSSVGKFKIDIMKQRLLDISPSCIVTCIYDFITPDNALQVIDQLSPLPTICVDAIDGHIEKSSLIAACCVRGVPIVSCGGSAGRSDPTCIRVDDLSRVSDCRLLFQCKKRLRDQYRLFAKGPTNHERGDKVWKSRKWNIRTIYSTEVVPMKRQHVDTESLNHHNSESTCDIMSRTKESSSLRMCDSGNLGTACFVTGAFGFFAASEVVSMIAKNELKLPRILKTHWLASTEVP